MRTLKKARKFCSWSYWYVSLRQLTVVNSSASMTKYSDCSATGAAIFLTKNWLLDLKKLYSLSHGACIPYTTQNSHAYTGKKQMAVKKKTTLSEKMNVASTHVRCM